MTDDRLTMESSVATASIGPLRRRAPSARSPSHAQQQQAVVSRGIHVPRGSPQQSAAAAGHSGSHSGGDGRCWCWCRTLAFGVCICLLAVTVFVALQYVKPSDTPTSGGIGDSARGTSYLVGQQQQQQQQPPHRRTAARAPQHALGEEKREAAPASNSIFKQKNQWDYSSRFPVFGTPEHSKACGGRETSARMETSTKCSVLVRPDPNGSEGLALWASNVVMGYFIHRQIANGACNLYIDFGVGVNVEAALTTPTAPDSTAEQATVVWSVPPKGFVCRIEDSCHYVWTEPSSSAYRYSYRQLAEGDSTAATAKGRRTQREYRTKHNHQELQQQQQQLAAVPFYRFAYSPRYERLSADNFMELERSLLGRFDVHTGFACAFSLLFQLSPEAVRYEPTLFNYILPTLQDPHNAVVGMYIRTGATEGKTSAGAGYEAVDDAEAHIAAAAEILSCALKQETHFASGANEESGGLLRARKPVPQSIVWMVVTDSQHLKEYISKEYGGKDVVVVVGDTADDPARRTRTIPRDVITTSSQGTHTRPKGAVNNNNNNESDGGVDSQRTEAFASAVIDWWLLGESDVVISSTEYTFGNTGAMRTARPVYQRVLERNDEGSFVNNACGFGRIAS